MLTVHEVQDRCRQNALRCVRSDPRRQWERQNHPRRPQGLQRPGVANRYGGLCVDCGLHVPPLGGEAVLSGRRWRVLCSECTKPA